MVKNTQTSHVRKDRVVIESPRCSWTCCVAHLLLGKGSPLAGAAGDEEMGDGTSSASTGLVPRGTLLLSSRSRPGAAGLRERRLSLLPLLA